MKNQALVIRPEPNASELVSMLREIDVDAIALPLIEFKPHPDLNSLSESFNKLRPEDWVIAVSARAILYAQQQLKKEGSLWPDVNYAAIGDNSGKLLHDYTQKNILTPPHPQNSETFLALPAIEKIHSERCLILRGDSGRELIKERLESQGTKISYCETYKKIKKNIDVKQFLSAKYQNIDTLIVTSGQQLEYLSEMVEKKLHLWLHTRILYVPSDRIKQKAMRMGFQSIYSVGSAANADILAAFKKHRK